MMKVKFMLSVYMTSLRKPPSLNCQKLFRHMKQGFEEKRTHL